MGGLIEPDPDDEIWRYMDFYQLISILERGKLYFRRADLMADPFEGSVPYETLQKEKKKKKNIAERGDDLSNETREKVSNSRKRNKKTTFLNCWHLNKHGESAAMWDLYSNKGVAVKTTYSNLKESFQNPGYDIKMSKVKYRDFRPDGDEMDEEDRGISWSHYLYKRKSFEHENEVRAIARKQIKVKTQELEEPRNAKLDEIHSRMLTENLFIEVDIHALIEEVRIHPKLGNNFEYLITWVLKKGGFSSDIVKKSDLSTNPLY